MSSDDNPISVSFDIWTGVKVSANLRTTTPGEREARREEKREKRRRNRMARLNGDGYVWVRQPGPAFRGIFSCCPKCRQHREVHDLHIPDSFEHILKAGVWLNIATRVNHEVNRYRNTHLWTVGTGWICLIFPLWNFLCHRTIIMLNDEPPYCRYGPLENRLLFFEFMLILLSVGWVSFTFAKNGWVDNSMRRVVAGMNEKYRGEPFRLEFVSIRHSAFSRSRYFLIQKTSPAGRLARLTGTHTPVQPGKKTAVAGEKKTGDVVDASSLRARSVPQSPQAESAFASKMRARARRNLKIVNELHAKGYIGDAEYTARSRLHLSQLEAAPTNSPEPTASSSMSPSMISPSEALDELARLKQLSASGQLSDAEFIEMARPLIAVAKNTARAN